MDRLKTQCGCVGFGFSVGIHGLRRFYRVTITTIIIGSYAAGNPPLSVRLSAYSYRGLIYHGYARVTGTQRVV